MHLLERFDLFTIILLGESIISLIAVLHLEPDNCMGGYRYIVIAM
ncbi:low temperature requirement protein A [Halobacillus karajensis]